MSDSDPEVGLVTAEVGIPDEEFMDELMEQTDEETLDDLVTRLVDHAVRKSGDALDHEPERVQEIEIPKDSAMRFSELMRQQNETVDDVGSFMTYTLAAQYINSISRNPL